MLGLDRRNAGQLRFGQFVAAEFRGAFADFLKLVLATDLMRTCEVKLQGDGSLLSVLIEGIAAGGPPGQQRLCRAAVIDVTQQKRADELAAANQALEAEIAAREHAEEAMRAARDSAEQAKAAAEQANRAKDHFLAVLSHELRTPLTPVVMGLSMLQRRPDLDPEVRGTLEMVRRNVEMEARLIDDLLDMTRIARGKIALTRGPIDLCTVIRYARSRSANPTSRRAGCTLGWTSGQPRLTGLMPTCPGSSRSSGTSWRMRSSSRRTAGA